MSAEATSAVAALNERFLLDFPHEAAREIEAMPAEDAAEVLTAALPRAVVRAWQALAPDVAREVLERLPPTLAAHLLGEAEPAAAVEALAQLGAEERASGSRFRLSGARACSSGSRDQGRHSCGHGTPRRSASARKSEIVFSGSSRPSRAWRASFRASSSPG